MSRLLLDNITVEFPLLHVGHRSLKKAIVSRATGGRILKEADSPKIVRAIEDLTLDLKPGDRLGLVGPNGAGKTTLLRVMAGIYEPVAGRVLIEGRVASLLDVSAGMNHELTGWENIELRGALQGLNRTEIQQLADNVEEFCELGEFLNMPLRTYSSGMMLRVAFAVATAVHADVLLMDEWVLAGDAAFQSKAEQRLTSLVQSASIMVLASHNLEIVQNWCTKAAYIKNGTIRFVGSVEEAIDRYQADI